MGTRRRSLLLSLPRRWIGDVVHFAQRVPLIPFERRMNLSALAAARRQLAAPPGWCALFVKAYALVAVRRPELRRAYLPLPLPRLYEHPHSIAMVTIERRYRDEDAVFPTPLYQPEDCSLCDLNALIRQHKTEPVEQFEAYRRLILVSRLPRPLRRLVWQLGLDLSGQLRATFFGTFCVSVTAGLGAAALYLLAPTTTTLWYGPLDEAGRLDVRLAFDHRVLDGAPVARALAELEEVLHDLILPELLQQEPASTRRSA